MRLRNRIKKIVLGTGSFRKPSIAYSAHNGLLPGVVVRTPSAKLRELLLLPESPNVTQLNQDMFALLVNRFEPGFFVEIGANDGYTLSNTVYLEEHFSWNGLLVEANPQYWDSLKGRKAKSVIAAVVEREGYVEFVSAGLYGGVADRLDPTHENRTREGRSIAVLGTTLGRILDENDAPPVINFISVDVEGGEVPIVEQMCGLRDYRFLSGCIEHNGRQEDYDRITRLLRESGYRVVWEGQTQHDLFFVWAGDLTSHG